MKLRLFKRKQKTVTEYKVVKEANRTFAVLGKYTNPGNKASDGYSVHIVEIGDAGKPVSIQECTKYANAVNPGSKLVYIVMIKDGNSIDSTLQLIREAALECRSFFSGIDRLFRKSIRYIHQN